MKTCPKCKQQKDRGEFNRKRDSKDGLASICRECNRQNNNRNYRKNKKSYLERARKNRQASRKWLREYKTKLYCSRCGFNEHPRALDFHHNENKDEMVGRMANEGYSKERILEEIRKCDILCSNCHRILHAEES